VWRSDIASLQRDRKALIALPFQLPSDGIDPECTARGHVFDHNPSWLELADDAGKLPP
jgi:hypothetical protein